MANGISATTVEHLDEVGSLSQDELIEAITEGLPADLARELASRLDISMEQLAGLLRLTPRTLQRRLEGRRLHAAESDKLWELWRLFSRAAEVLEDENGAVHWLKSPIQATGWVAPLDLARTAPGLRELENILGRIEHGIFS